jgi:hypothetical protein
MEAPMQRLLIVIGAVLLVAGFAWPLLTKLGLGHLPGDIRVEREGYSFYFPIATCIVVSLAVSLLIWLFRR